MGAERLAEPVVGMAATPSGHGYWLVAADGGIFTYGDAGYLGSMGGQHLDAPIVGMAATPDGRGLLARGVRRRGLRLRRRRVPRIDGQASTSTPPVVSMAATPDGDGYWLVASDGGVFAFGDAVLLRVDGQPSPSPPRWWAWRPRHSGHGYWLVGSDGGVFAFGDAGFFGSMGAQQLQNPITAIAATPDGGGYWLLPTTPERVGNAQTRLERPRRAGAPATTVLPRLLARDSRR